MKKLLAGVLVTAALLLVSSPAAECAGEELSFSLSLNYPGDQLEPNAGYFYVPAGAGETRTLTVTAHNDSAAPLTLTVETADCYTSPQGSLVYLTGTPEKGIGFVDSRYSMSGMIAPSKTSVDLQPGASSDVSLTVTCPALDTGEVIGAVRFSELSRPSPDPSPNGSSIQLTVKKAMTIPVRLQLPHPVSDGTPAVIVGDIVIGDGGGIFLTLSNSLPAISRSVHIGYRAADNAGRVLNDGSIDLDRMAPKTRVAVPVSLGSAPVGPGTYRLSITYPAGDSGTATETRELTVPTSYSAPPQGGPSPRPVSAPVSASIAPVALIVLLSAVIVVLVVVIVVLLTRRKKR